MASKTTEMLDKILSNQKYISLTTYRKNGEEVSTPIWFARENDDIYIMTEDQSWKVKRLRNNPKVAFVPCNYIGKLKRKFSDLQIQGDVEFLEGGDVYRAEQRIAEKYRLLYRFTKRESNIFLRIMPTAILKRPETGDQESCE